MIVFTELQMMGDKHVQVNSSMFFILKKTYPKTPLYVYTDEVHLNNIFSKQDFKNPNIAYKTFHYNKKLDNIKTHILNKIIREIRSCLKIFSIAKKNKAMYIFFASAFPSTQIFIFIYSKIFKRNVIVCQHGDLGILSLKKDKLTTKVFRYVIKKMLLVRDPKYSKILFYGESIKKELNLLFPEISVNEVITIDHPYDYSLDQIKKSLGDTIKIANIGAAILAKNSQFLYKLAESTKKYVQSNKIIFLQIGNLHDEIFPYINEYVKGGDTDFLSSNEFVSQLRNVNYFIYFFGDGYYNLCPSGTFFDSVRYLTPIIALKNPFFDYYFNKLGDIGYLCNDLDDMKNVIIKIIDQKNNVEYNKKIDNLRAAQTTLSLDNISISFKKQVGNLKFI